MSEATAPQPPAPRRRSRWRIALISLAGLLVIAVAAGAFYAYRIDRNVLQNINRADTLPSEDPSGSPRPTKEPTETGTLNYVLLGSDSRETDPGEGRSDSIMVVHLNKARDKAYIISFPRDMWVEIPGRGQNKINAAYALGGPQLTVRTLENLTGVRMDHVVLVDFQGFIDLTTDLGGVTVTNKTAFSSHGFDYPKGKITISGEEALWFVRERKALPGGDLDRAENQRNVIKAIVAKGLSAEVVSDPARFTAFIGNLATHLTVDQQLTDREIRQTALSLRLDGSDIVLLQAPLAGFDTIAGQSVDVVDQAKMRELSRALKTNDLAGYVKKYPKG